MSRFNNVIRCLQKLKAENQDGALQREVDLAIQMIIGKRPNVEEKYDALLLKLDRSYSQLEDVRDKQKEVSESSTLHQTRHSAKIRVKCLNRMITSLAWMRARNGDLIKAAHGSLQKTSEAELSPEVPEQAD